MRVACVHIPQFALQCATRLDPSLRGAPVAMVSGLDPRLDPAGLRAVHHAPTVLACSRAAWALGVRLGMTATAARARSAELRVVSAEPATERDAIRALADALLSVSSVVDPGGRVGAGGAHLAIYAEVPARTRGGSFGERLVELAGEIGFSVRVGIADDRFTAWVAASHVVGSSAATTSSVVATTVAASTVAASTVAARSSLLHAAAPPAQGALHVDEPTVVMVPRGGSAAFLSARPLSLLAIPPEVQHVLEGLGVRTLGEFAALPAPSVARPLEADYQALARGDSGAQLLSLIHI